MLLNEKNKVTNKQKTYLKDIFYLFHLLEVFQQRHGDTENSKKPKNVVEKLLKM